MEAEALGATTPDVSLVAPDVGQPAPDAGVVLEGQQVEQLAPVEESWFLKSETGSVYKTREAAEAGIAEKDRLIKQFMSGQSQQPAAPQASPQDTANAAIAQLQAEYIQDLRSDPRFQGASQEAIEEQAYINAKAEYRIQQRMTQQYDERQQRQAHQQFIQNTPELKTDIARQVFDRYVEQYGIPPIDPQHHLTLVHAEMYRLQQGGHSNSGVSGAVLQQQQQQQRIFGGVQGVGAPAAQALPPRVQAAVDYYTGTNPKATPEQIERVKQRAIENEGRFKR